MEIKKPIDLNNNKDCIDELEEIKKIITHIQGAFEDKNYQECADSNLAARLRLEMVAITTSEMFHAKPKPKKLNTEQLVNKFSEELQSVVDKYKGLLEPEFIVEGIEDLNLKAE